MVSRLRPVLHPVAPALLLAVLGATGAVLAARGVGAAVLLLAATAGAGAGFANSGST
ncbi:MAG: hypothetical protein L0H64_07460 [Pseudonocardia sp.]|nr:hypothetical protein [Pseudonocardia sp.]